MSLEKGVLLMNDSEKLLLSDWHDWAAVVSGHVGRSHQLETHVCNYHKQLLLDPLYATQNLKISMLSQIYFLTV